MLKYWLDQMSIRVIGWVARTRSSWRFFNKSCRFFIFYFCLDTWNKCDGYHIGYYFSQHQSAVATYWSLQPLSSTHRVTRRDIYQRWIIFHRRFYPKPQRSIYNRQYPPILSTFSPSLLFLFQLSWENYLLEKTKERHREFKYRCVYCSQFHLHTHIFPLCEILYRF